jgi:hypothetical protein
MSLRDARKADEGRIEPLTTSLAVWQPEDTAENGPSLDYQNAHVLVESYYEGSDQITRLHFVTSYEGLWTVVADMPSVVAVKLATAIITATGKTLTNRGQ